MPGRDFTIYGECLVRVKGGIHTGILTSGFISVPVDLGLAEKEIRIQPKFFHDEIHADDYGGRVPADLMTLLSEATISMTLVHYDPLVLDTCVSEAMGGYFPQGAAGLTAGTVAPAGLPMDNMLPLYASGNHMISVGIVTGRSQPFRFPKCVLTGPPFEIPIGTKRSLVHCEWRALPYVRPPSPLRTNFEVLQSSGAVVWDRNAL